MREFLDVFPSYATIVFTWTSMLSLGLSHTFAEIFAPFRHVGRVLAALFANFVLVPLAAILIIRAFNLQVEHAVGLLLLASAGGAPIVVAMVRAARGEQAIVARLIVLLVSVTVVYMPLVVPWVLSHPDLSGMGSAEVSMLAIAQPLLVNVLLPLAIGLVVRWRAASFAARVRPYTGRLATISLVLLLLVTTFGNLGDIADLFTTPAIAAMLVFTVAAFAIGYVSGGRDRERRVVFGLGTGQRDVAVAAVVATQTIGNDDTLVMVLDGSLAAVLLLFGIAMLLRLRRRAPERTPEPWEAPLAPPAKA
jgi:BASS family bile acid:Na+ symporter